VLSWHVGIAFTLIVSCTGEHTVACMSKELASLSQQLERDRIGIGETSLDAERGGQCEGV